MVKTFKTYFFLEQTGRNLVCRIGYTDTTKIVQIMTLGWPWPFSRQGQISFLVLLYGKVLEHKNS